MKRNIVQIHEELCNGCGLCVSACHEGAIQLVSGKAKLISDIYCDGLGDCLPACPTGAIEIIERDAQEYSQEAVDQLLVAKQTGGGCPGSKTMNIQRAVTSEKAEVPVTQLTAAPVTEQEQGSELVNWPVQIKLANTKAEYFAGANLLIAADCTAFAYANFHRDFVKDRIVLIGCPKLDDNQLYAEKLAELFTINDIKSITVLRMEVPCCSGIVQSVKSAILKSQKIVPYNEVTIKLNGEIAK